MNKVERFTLADFKIYYKVIVWQSGPVRQSPKIDPHIYSHLVYENDTTANVWEKRQSFQLIVPAHWKPVQKDSEPWPQFHTTNKN